MQSIPQEEQNTDFLLSFAISSRFFVEASADALPLDVVSSPLAFLSLVEETSLPLCS